jgi:nicotinamidase/pyrazinamidase
MSKKAVLFIIDPQVDFCRPDGKLYVEGANEDMKRLAVMINKFGEEIEDINITMDSHHQYHIAHPMMWIDQAGNHPSPFTIVSKADVETGKWRTKNPSSAVRAYGLSYVSQLEANGRYPLCIWPEHCLIGTEGHNVMPDLMTEVLAWERKNYGIANTITKGSNWKTEHYSAVKADVVDPCDVSTNLNGDLIGALVNAVKDGNQILVAGEALSHCVANTIRDVVLEFDPAMLSNFTILEDCTSPVGGLALFKTMADGFMSEMIGKGMQVAKSTNYF